MFFIWLHLPSLAVYGSPVTILHLIIICLNLVCDQTVVKLYGCEVVMSESSFPPNMPSFPFCISATLWKLGLPSQSPDELRVSSLLCYLATTIMWKCSIISSLNICLFQWLGSPITRNFSTSLFYFSAVKNLCCVVAKDISSEAHILGSDHSSVTF